MRLALCCSSGRPAGLLVGAAPALYLLLPVPPLTPVPRCSSLQSVCRDGESRVAAPAVTCAEEGVPMLDPAWVPMLDPCTVTVMRVPGT
jgi:hypothetical protein